MLAERLHSIRQKSEPEPKPAPLSHGEIVKMLGKARQMGISFSLAHLEDRLPEGQDLTLEQTVKVFTDLGVGESLARLILQGNQKAHVSTEAPRQEEHVIGEESRRLLKRRARLKEKVAKNRLDAELVPQVTGSAEAANPVRRRLLREKVYHQVATVFEITTNGIVGAIGGFFGGLAEGAHNVFRAHPEFGVSAAGAAAAFTAQIYVYLEQGARISGEVLKSFGVRSVVAGTALLVIAPVSSGLTSWLLKKRQESRISGNLLSLDEKTVKKSVIERSLANTLGRREFLAKSWGIGVTALSTVPVVRGLVRMADVVARKPNVVARKPELLSPKAAEILANSETLEVLPKVEARVEEVKLETDRKTPFFSQFHPESPKDIKNMGCGPISLAMELAFRGKISPDWQAAEGVTRRAQCLGFWNAKGTNVAKMEKLAGTYGIAAEHKSLAGFGELVKVLDTSQNPVIAGFKVDGDLDKIGHLLLVLAVDQEKGLVYTHDCATKPPEAGQNRVYPLDVFKAAWVHQKLWVVTFGKEADTHDADGLPNYLLPSVLKWRGKIKEWSKEYSLDPKAIAVLMQLESAGNPNAHSEAGADGLFQVMPLHFKEGEKPLDPDTNAKRGLSYFKLCLAKAEKLGYKGADALAEAAKGYNGGIGSVGREGESLYQETKNFQRWFRGLHTGDHGVIDEWYCLYAEHL